MGGMNQSFIDKILGYDDGYKSSPMERQFYHKLANHTKARPEWMLSLSHSELLARDPGNDAEYIVQKIVATTLTRMRTDPRQL